MQYMLVLSDIINNVKIPIICYYHDMIWFKYSLQSQSQTDDRGGSSQAL